MNLILEVLSYLRCVPTSTRYAAYKKSLPRASTGTKIEIVRIRRRRKPRGGSLARIMYLEYDYRCKTTSDHQAQYIKPSWEGLLAQENERKAKFDD